MSSDFLLNTLAKGSNPTADAFKAKSAELQAGRDAEAAKIRDETARKDNQTLKVFEMLGDGYVNEARFMADRYGLNVPDEAYNNSTFAKAMTSFGKLAPANPELGQEYGSIYMTTQGDDLARATAAWNAVKGRVVNADDRKFNLWKRQEDEKRKYAKTKGDTGFTLSPGQSRFVGGELLASVAPKDDAPPLSEFLNKHLVNTRRNESNSMSVVDPKTDEQILLEGKDLYQQIFGEQQPVQEGAGGLASPVDVNPDATAQARGIYAVQQLFMQGYTQEQIRNTLLQKGASEAQIQALLNKVGM